MVGGQRMMRGAGQRKTMNEEEKILNRNSVNTGTVTMRQTENTRSIGNQAHSKNLSSDFLELRISFLSFSSTEPMRKKGGHAEGTR